jgi:hypothetical protein
METVRVGMANVSLPLTGTMTSPVVDAGQILNLPMPSRASCYRYGFMTHITVFSRGHGTASAWTSAVCISISVGTAQHNM